MKISICVPVYEMGSGMSSKFLEEYLDHLTYQTYEHFEVVVSDQSNSTTLKNVCERFTDKLEIRYVVNNTLPKNAANNVNYAVQHATGDVVKLLYMDDFFIRKDALAMIAGAFETNSGKWLICGFTHCNQDKSYFFDTRVPSYPNKYVNGDNTTGNPSTYAVRREYVIEMDTNLLWVVDGEYFYRSYHFYGDPIIIEDTLVCFREHSSSAFRDPALMQLEKEERQYCRNKYNMMLAI